MIVSPFPDSPADEAGILANDLVVEVDGENVSSKFTRGNE